MAKRSKFTIKKNEKYNVASVQNNQGTFTHIRSKAVHHGQSQLIISPKGKNGLILNGRQINTLRRVLAAV